MNEPAGCHVIRASTTQEYACGLLLCLVTWLPIVFLAFGNGGTTTLYTPKKHIACRSARPFKYKLSDPSLIRLHRQVSTRRAYAVM